MSLRFFIPIPYLMPKKKILSTLFCSWRNRNLCLRFCYSHSFRLPVQLWSWSLYWVFTIYFYLSGQLLEPLMKRYMMLFQPCHPLCRFVNNYKFDAYFITLNYFMEIKRWKIVCIQHVFLNQVKNTWYNNPYSDFSDLYC